MIKWARVASARQRGNLEKYVLDLSDMIPLLVSGFLAVTTIDMLGSIASRKLNFNYAYLTPLSFLVYFSLGYRGHFLSSLPWTLIIACLTGVYDATVGWRLSIILRANFADKEEYSKTLRLSTRLATMLVLSGVLGFLGYIVAGYL
jgi:hypothetical protein